MSLVAPCSSHWCLLAILTLLATRISGWSFVTADGTVQIASPISVQPLVAATDPAISFARSGASEPKWKIRLDGSDRLSINQMDNGILTEVVKFDPAPQPNSGNSGMTIKTTLQVKRAVNLKNMLLVGGNTKLQRHFAVSANQNVDLSSGAHSIDETFTVVTTSHLTNQANLPQRSAAGQMFIVCNSHSSEATIGTTASGTMIMDGAALASTAPLAPYQCRQFISDATHYYAVNSGSSSSGPTPGPTPSPTPPPTPGGGAPATPAPPPRRLGDFGPTTITGDLTISGDLTVDGGNIVATVPSQAKKIYETTTANVALGGGAVDISAAGSTTTVKGNLEVSENSTFVGGIMTKGGDIVAAATSDAQHVYATTTGKLTLGGGDIDISASGSSLDVQGALEVSQTTTLVGDTTLSSSVQLSTDPSVDISAGSQVLAGKTMNVVTTAHATNKVNLPNPSIAGRVYYVCNTHGFNAIVGDSGGASIIVDGQAPTASTIVPRWQCRQFIGDGTYWHAINPYTGSFQSVKVYNTQVVGYQQSAVSDVSQAIPASISDTFNQAEAEQVRAAVAELKTGFNDLLSKLRTHGLIQT